MEPLQAMINGMSAGWQKERAETQMTLGQLISTLESMPRDTLVYGLGELNSYRGYYSDLAFTETNKYEKADSLLERCRGAMGKIYEGYKGGSFGMNANTPLWVVEDASRCGPRLMGFDDDGRPVVAVEDEEDL